MTLGPHFFNAQTLILAQLLKIWDKYGTNLKIKKPYHTDNQR